MQSSHTRTDQTSSIDAWTALDILPDYLTVIDADGMIRYVNHAWQTFPAAPLKVGVNYLTAGLAMLAPDDSHALRAGVRAVLAGNQAQVELEQKWHTGDQLRWFTTTILPCSVDNTRGALLQQRDITAQRQEQQNGNDPVRFVQTFIDAVPGPIFYKDTNGIYLGCNQAFMDYLGKCREEIIGKTAYDLAPPELADIYHQADLELMEQGGTQTYESQVIYADGSRHDVVFNKAVFLNADGTTGGLIGVMLDITERKHTEEALRRRDAILEAISFAAGRFLEATAWNEDIQLVLAQLGAATRVSRIYIFQNHLSENGLLAMSQRYEWAAPGIMPQIDNPELQNLTYRDAGFERWVAKLGQGEPVYGLVKTFPADEAEHLAAQDIRSIAVVPIFVRDTWWGFIGFDECRIEHNWSAQEVDTLRVAAGIIGTAILRGQMEQDMQQSEQRYREIFENASDIIYTHDLEGRYTSVNRAAEQLSGYTRDELIGMHVAEIIAPEYIDQANAMQQQKLATGGTTPYEIEVLTRDGRRVTLETNTRLIYQDGQPIGVQGTARDITERKQSEEAMRRLVWQEEVIRIQEATLAELSTPLLVIADQIVLMPLIGAIDSHRAYRAMEELLQGVAANHARVVILDISGVPIVDTQVASVLIRAAQAVRLLGAQVIVTGIGPDIAQTLVSMGITLEDLVTQARLQSGVAYALKHWGVGVLG
jgi:PAS domain S-box-containing protein